MNNFVNFVERDWAQQLRVRIAAGIGRRRGSGRRRRAHSAAGGCFHGPQRYRRAPPLLGLLRRQHRRRGTHCPLGCIRSGQSYSSSSSHFIFIVNTSPNYYIHYHIVYIID